MSDAAERSKNADARTALLAAARALMLQDGGSFTVKAVCARAGLGRAAFNSHFANKAALLAALVAAPQPVAAPVEAKTEAPAAPVLAAATVMPAPGVAQADAWLERRLRVFERSLAALEAKVETANREQARAVALLEERLAVLQNAAAAPAAPLATAAPLLTAAPAPTLTAAPQSATLPAADLPQDAQVPESPAAPDANTEPLPSQTPRADTVSREEMAGVLANARRVARDAAAEDSVPKNNAAGRLRWIAAAALGLVAVLVGVGLSLDGGSAGASQSPTHSAAPKAAAMADHGLAATPLGRLMASAGRGDAKAQARLAFAYLRGEGVAPDPAAAQLWAAEAARHGEPMAQYLLGTLCSQGDGRSGAKSDPARAFGLFSAAAAQGNIKAMHNLAIAYAEGVGTPTDPVLAAQWFYRAAAHGYVDSAFDLAVLYERGLGVRQSLKDALRWYSVAAMAGDRPSAERAAFLRQQVSPKEAVLAANEAASFAPLEPVGPANRL